MSGAGVRLSEVRREEFEIKRWQVQPTHKARGRVTQSTVMLSTRTCVYVSFSYFLIPRNQSVMMHRFSYALVLKTRRNGWDCSETHKSLFRLIILDADLQEYSLVQKSMKFPPGAYFGGEGIFESRPQIDRDHTES